MPRQVVPSRIETPEKSAMITSNKKSAALLSSKAIQLTYEVHFNWNDL